MVAYYALGTLDARWLHLASGRGLVRLSLDRAAASHPILLGHPPRRRARCAQHHSDEPDGRDAHRPGGALREPRASRLRCRSTPRVSADSARLRSRLGAGRPWSAPTSAPASTPARAASCGPGAARRDRADREHRADRRRWLPTCGWASSARIPTSWRRGATYLHIVGPAYGFFGLGLSLYFASQGLRAARLAPDRGIRAVVGRHGRRLDRRAPVRRRAARPSSRSSRWPWSCSGPRWPSRYGGNHPEHLAATELYNRTHALHTASSSS